MQTVGCLLRKLVKGSIKTYTSMNRTKFICKNVRLDTPSVTLSGIVLDTEVRNCNFYEYRNIKGLTIFGLIFSQII